ncbi:MAG: hypothetical protein E6049_00385 [Varibaculum cambriense]|nr:hypothetical protein [Varibaculum cambriense]
MEINEGRRQTLGTALKTVGVGIASALIAITLLVLANALPTGRVAGHVSESMPMYLHEGDYPNEMPGLPGGRRDNFTEAIMLTMAIYPSNNAPFNNTIVSHRLTGSPDSTGETPRVENLSYALSHLNDPNYVAQAGAYTRYWHGYLVVLKPLLLMFNPAQIRFLNLSFQIILVGLTCLALAKKTSPKMSLVVLGTYIFLNPIATALSFQYYSIFYCAFIGALVGLTAHEYLHKHRLWPAFFLVLGMAVSFSDFLTYPVFALGLPLLIYVLVSRDCNLSKVIGNSVVWATGYVGFWSLKWFLAALFANQPLSSVKEYIFFRLDSSGRGTELANRFAFNRFDGIRNNLSPIVHSAPVVFLCLLSLLLIGALLILKIVRFDSSSAFPPRNNLYILVVAGYPMIWYLVVLNHSAIHAFFTYRNLGVSVFAALLFGLQFISRGSSRSVLGSGPAE